MFPNDERGYNCPHGYQTTKSGNQPPGGADPIETLTQHLQAPRAKHEAYGSPVPGQSYMYAPPTSRDLTARRKLTVFSLGSSMENEEYIESIRERHSLAGHVYALQQKERSKSQRKT